MLKRTLFWALLLHDARATGAQNDPSLWTGALMLYLQMFSKVEGLS